MQVAYAPTLGVGESPPAVGFFASGPFAAGLIAGGLFASGLNAAPRWQSGSFSVTR